MRRCSATTAVLGAKCQSVFLNSVKTAPTLPESGYKTTSVLSLLEMTRYLKPDFAYRIKHQMI